MTETLIRNRPVVHRHLIIVLLCCLAVPIIALPAGASQVWASDDSGMPVDFFAANEVVYASGDLTRTSEDPAFPYRARVYVTANRDTWVYGQGLNDVSGSFNIAIGNMYGSSFIGLPLWLPMLVPGYYDIVLDENQNGVYDCDAGTGTCDSVLGDPDTGPDHAFSVTPSTGKPVVDKAKIKSDAQDLADRYRKFPQYLEWSTTALSLAQTTAEIATATSTGQVMVTLIGSYAGQFIPMSYNDAVISQGQQIIRDLCSPLNAKYQALANDPPDPNFTEIVTLGPVPSYPAPSGEMVAIAQAELAGRLAEQEALVAALTRSLEKLDGARAADDDHAILLQAGSVRRYADLLRANYAGSIAAINVYSGVIRARGGDHTVSASNVTALHGRIRSNGFSAAEMTMLKNFGMSDPEIATLRQEIIDWDITGLADFNEYAMWQDLLSSIDAADADMAGVSSDAAAIIAYYAYSVDDDYPAANAGGPYTGTAGVPVSLDGTGSSDPDGDPLAYAWDCDGDEAFDDATGASPSCTWDSPGTRLAGLRVTDIQGLSGFSYAKVTIAAANLAPVAVSVSPAESAPVVGTGETLSFTALYEDPDLDPLTYAWTLDGNTVSSSSSWQYTGLPADHGKMVALTVSDTDPYSPDARRVWRLVIQEAVQTVLPLPGYTNSPTDPDNDGIYEDLNGNGRLDFADVVLYFNQMTWISNNEPIAAFDLNGNGRIDFADIVALFNEI